MKVLVTGATGQVGYDVCRELKSREINHLGVSSKEMDLTRLESVNRIMLDYQPDVVVHCAAFTAVDQSEDEPEKCRAVNVTGTEILARQCGAMGAKLFYTSSDYVFAGEGDAPYEPDDATGALNVCGQSKLDGEKAVLSFAPKHFVVRISWVFGINGRNFVRTMLELGKNNSVLQITGDQWGSPTYTRDLAILCCDMIQTERYGIYHATNEGFCSWAEFAQEIFNQAGMNVAVSPRTEPDPNKKAARPHNSRLSKKCLDRSGFKRLPPWQDAVHRYLKELKQSGLL